MPIVVVEGEVTVYPPTTPNNNITFLIQMLPMNNVVISDLIYTYQINWAVGTLAVWDEIADLQIYNMNNFNIHCPSEHTIDGYNFDCEV